MTKFESYFEKFRKNIIGIDQKFTTPFGEKKIIYSDWIASGRLYGPIEDKIRNVFGPFIGNTHTETNVTGTTMTKAYHFAHEAIKKGGVDKVLPLEKIAEKVVSVCDL